MINAYALAIVATFASAVELLAPGTDACPKRFDEFEYCRGMAQQKFIPTEDEYVKCLNTAVKIEVEQAEEAFMHPPSEEGEKKFKDASSHITGRYFLT